MSLLEYEQQIFLDAFHEDGLLITARGLGLERIVISFLKVYCDPANLVLVLNTASQDEDFYVEELEKDNTSPLPKVITNEYNASDSLKYTYERWVTNLVHETGIGKKLDYWREMRITNLMKPIDTYAELVDSYGTENEHYHSKQIQGKQLHMKCCGETRLTVLDSRGSIQFTYTSTTNSCNRRQKLYLQGGVLFITSRILVVDLLTDRVPVENITGIIVCRAHRVVESCQEAFILRLYRQKNKTGFIKAFSHNATAFMTGFSHVERTMKNLFVRKLFLWPRFHANVQETLEKHKVDVVEIHVQLTDAMLACQTALLDLLNACVKELKRCNTAIDSEEITVENAIAKSFDQMIRLQLDPIWHQLGPKTKQLVNDIKTLRLILRHLTQYDCVTFYNMVNSVRTSEKTFGQNTGWLFLESADSLFVHARLRVYGDDASRKKLKAANEGKDVPELEPCPKWEALLEVVDEISEHNKSADESLGPGRVLIAAEDDRTCAQIKEFLCDGSKSLLARLYNKSLANKGEYIEEVKKRPASKHKKQTEDTVTLTQMMAGKSNENGDKKPDEGGPLTTGDVYYGVLPDPVTILHPLHDCSDPFSLVRTLAEVQPRYIILYDPDMEFVRQVEVYRASHPESPLRVYFLMYTGSVEEQRYLTTLRKEKEAFEYLIREKATMVIPEEREGKMENDLNLARDVTPAAASANTRKGGQQVQQPSSNKVIVDMREFRSELPSLIHKRGMDIEPVTLEVGDYILTPDMCVERKSVSDLIGSLNNGRLYNQCVSMCRYYKRPILLIEFDANKSFSLQGKYQISNDVSVQETTTRLTLLTLHFPKLRILWCQSPYATAELFEELKTGRDQPNAVDAMTVTSVDDIEVSDRYSHNSQDMLLRMPGVNSRNYRLIMNKVENLHQLSTLSEQELTGIMGSSQHAKQLWNFLHSEHNATDGANMGKSTAAKSDLAKKWSKRKR